MCDGSANQMGSSAQWYWWQCPHTTRPHPAVCMPPSGHHHPGPHPHCESAQQPPPCQARQGYCPQVPELATALQNPGLVLQEELHLKIFILI